MQLFQGEEEPAHDFLSLHTGAGAAFPSPFHHNALRPLKLANHSQLLGAGNGAAEAAGSDERALPGGVGTFSIRQAAPCDPPSRDEAAGSHGGNIVNGASFVPVLHGSRSSGSRARRSPSMAWQDSGTGQRSVATKAEGRSSASSGDEGPSTPRSKHSATEQRRRTKINDRLEVLRDLLPHCDQKRDKASFLLEVIEYIRFLQEKVQKYESSDPERNNEDSKSMPWAKVYYRSCWRNTQNNSQVQGEDLPGSTQDMNKEQSVSEQVTVTPAALFSIQNARETSTSACAPHMATATAQNWEKSVTPSNQPTWLSMSTMRQDSNSDDRMLSKHDEQGLRNHTRSLSSAYSQGLLHRLTEALKKSGVDTSQAHISVEINMDRRGRENTSDSSKVNEDEEPIRITKRRRCDKS